MMGSWSRQNSGITWQTNEHWHLSELISREMNTWRIWPMEFLRGTRHELQEYLNLRSVEAEN